MAVRKLMMNIGIVCDMTCPYCWIGKRRLDASMQALKDRMEFQLHWLPYELRPDAPVEGMPIPDQYLIPSVLDQLKKSGEKLGLSLTYKYKKWPNTLRAHALVRLAGKKDGGAKQGEVVEMIYKTHFTDGTFMSEDVLVDIGQQAGYNADEVRTYITDPVRLENIHNTSEVNKCRVSGMIPVYFFNGVETIVGAQTQEEFTDKLIEAAKRVETITDIHRG